jgi:hypothetical protein
MTVFANGERGVRWSMVGGGSTCNALAGTEHQPCGEDESVKVPKSTSRAPAEPYR